MKNLQSFQQDDKLHVELHTNDKMSKNVIVLMNVNNPGTSETCFEAVQVRQAALVV